MKVSIEVESAVLRMGDLSVLIDVVEHEIERGSQDRAVRAALLLAEAFDSRYQKLLDLVEEKRK